MQTARVLCSQKVLWGGGGVFSRIGGLTPMSSVVSFECPSRTLSSFNGKGQDSYLLASAMAVQLGGVRYKFTKRPNQKVAAKDPEGVQYPGFVYFPRYPGQKDPPVEPSKLFMVKRIRSLFGCPYWEKNTMRQLQLDSRRTVVILKNTPWTNAKLYQIKHLVEITPITLPYGMPDSPENGFLKESGEFVSYNAIGQNFGDIKLEDAEKSVAEYFSKNMDRTTLKFRLRARWKSRYDVVN